MDTKQLPGKTVIYQYNTLEDIRARKAQLLEEIRQDNNQTGELWNSLFLPVRNASKGETMTSLVSYGINAIDAFLLIRKLTRRYSGLFSSKKGGKKRRR